MMTNLGSMDRMVRLSIASSMCWVVALGLAKGLWAFIPMAIAMMLVVTSHSGHCPVYRFFGWSTHTPTKRRA